MIRCKENLHIIHESIYIYICVCVWALYFYNYASDVSFQKDQLLTEVDGGFHYQNEACSIQMNNKIKIINICLPPICNISFCLE